MLSSLKPNKANVLGTAALLVANFVGGFVSRLVSQSVLPMISGDEAISAGRGAFQGGAGAAVRMGGFGLEGTIINLAVLGILFYVVISFAIWMGSKDEKATITPQK